MTRTEVVEVGPVSVHGTGAVDNQLACSAVEFIDDQLALLGDEPVPTAELWHDVMRSAITAPADRAVLICPTWWPRTRVQRVCAAAGSVATEVMTITRRDAACAAAGAAHPTVVEIGPEVVVIGAGDEPLRAVPRIGDGERVAEAVALAVGAPAAVAIDAPADVVGATELSGVVTRLLRRNAVEVSRVDRRSMRRAAATVRACDSVPPEATGPAMTRRGRRGAAVLTGAAVSVLGVGIAVGRPAAPSPGEPVTLLVEGRVGMKVPAVWAVERITGGTGSPRVQVTSPSDAHTALLLTQSPMASSTTLAQAADMLRIALADEQPGVFVDFVADGHRVGRPVVSYREIRAGRDIEWSVLIDGAVRIGIGCQHAPGTADQIRWACDQAIQSAHAIF